MISGNIKKGVCELLNQRALKIFHLYKTQIFKNMLKTFCSGISRGMFDIPCGVSNHLPAACWSMLGVCFKMTVATQV